MQTGRVVNMDFAPGLGAIQPDDGGELVSFAHSEVKDPIAADTPVVFDRKGTGIEVVNVRVVKAADDQPLSFS
jgi:hypothetical protein